VRPVELRDAADLLPELVRCFDEPFADPAAVPMWHLSAMAAGEVKAVLAGDGGDEVFAGYRRHRTEQRTGRVARFASLVRPAGRVLDALPALPSGRAERLRARLGRLRDAALLPDGATRFLARRRPPRPPCAPGSTTPASSRARTAPARWSGGGPSCCRLCPA
jgi:asparagine synthase (glutamine-hydrolysing)